MTTGTAHWLYDLEDGPSSSWTEPNDFNSYGSISVDRGHILNQFDGSREVGWVSHVGGLNSPVAEIPGTVGQNVAAAEPGFLSTAAGQQLLLKGGLMLAQMVLGATGATGKPKQPKREPLDPDKAKKIRNEAKNRHGLKRKKKKKEDEGLYS